MADDVKALSAELARDPQSLVFLRLGELLRRKGQFDAAQRVALHGLQRHPHLADAHDLYARILADHHDDARAFDEWDMALRIAPTHIGALKGLAFLYFKIGDVGQAEAHLQAALEAAPDDPSIHQAIAVVRGRGADPAAAFAGTVAPEVTPPPAPSAEPEPAAPPARSRAAAPPPPPAPPPAADEGAAPIDDARVFAGQEGAQEGLLLLDAAGRVLGGGLRDPEGRDVTDAVAAYLAGVSQEAARTAKLLGLGAWTGLSAEGVQGHVHLTPPAAERLLLVVRDRSIPMGRLAVVAQRATQAARRWLERQA
jgi:tetratricopeptide (TPR) repeat protein